MVEIKVRITAFSYKALKDLSREFYLDIVCRTTKEINENKSINKSGKCSKLVGESYGL